MLFFLYKLLTWDALFYSYRLRTRTWNTETIFKLYWLCMNYSATLHQVENEGGNRKFYNGMKPSVTLQRKRERDFCFPHANMYRNLFRRNSVERPFTNKYRILLMDMNWAEWKKEKLFVTPCPIVIAFLPSNFLAVLFFFFHNWITPVFVIYLYN